MFKVRNKASDFWKHGKHSHMREIAIMQNKKQVSKKAPFLKLDTSKQNWSLVSTKHQTTL
jgi:hypothetical protein